jgi:hypothetical protein
VRQVLKTLCQTVVFSAANPACNAELEYFCLSRFSPFAAFFKKESPLWQGWLTLE